MENLYFCSTRRELIEKIRYPIAYQALFLKKLSPWESNDNFTTFEVKDIKTIYYINIAEANKDERSYELVCRVHHKGQNYFIGMTANCNYKGFELNGGEGYLNITKYANIFLNDVVKFYQHHAITYEILKKEGYQLEEYKTYIYDKIANFLETLETNEKIEEDMEIFY